MKVTLTVERGSDALGVTFADLQARYPELLLGDVSGDEEQSFKERSSEGEAEFRGFDGVQGATVSDQPDEGVVSFECRLVDGFRVACELVCHVRTLWDAFRGVKS